MYLSKPEDPAIDPDIEEVWLPSAELVAKHKMHPNTLINWRKAGLLQTKKVIGVRLYLESEVAALADLRLRGKGTRQIAEDNAAKGGEPFHSFASASQTGPGSYEIVVDLIPRLNDEQRERIAALLFGNARDSHPVDAA